MKLIKKVVMLAITNRKILVLALCIIAIFLALSFYFVTKDTLQEWDFRIVDLLFRIRGPIPTSDQVTIVALDRESSRQLQRKTTAWKRSDFAQAIRALTDAGADLIAIDYLFAIADQDPNEDAALSSAMEESANVILASDISTLNRALPFAPLREQEVGEGFINFLPDPDGVVRQIPPLRAKTTPDGQIQLDFPFSVQVALAHLYPEADFSVNLSRPGEVTLGQLRIPYSDRETAAGFFINFTGPSEHFPILSLYKVLRGQFRKEEIAGKIVLIGSMNPYYHDYYSTPYRRPAIHEETINVEKKAMQSMFGVEIHANAIDTLIRRRFLSPIGLRTLVVALMFVSGLAVFLSIVVRWNVFLIAGVSLLLLGLLFVGSFTLFVQGWIVRGAPFYFCVAGVVLTGILSRQAEEASERRYITQLFGRYVAANVVQELLRNRDLVQLSGKKQRLTIFFSDIRGFTSMSEKMKPEEVSELLNEYFSAMTRLVFEHRGTLDKFMGDAIMAFFGNPVFFANHAEQAADMSLAMKEEMKRLKANWQAEGKEASFDIGIGINTGEVVVGNLGSKEFFDYTVIGDEVNLACRLESIAKRGQIIVSASTYEEINDLFDFLRLDPVTVKGKSQPVEIYELIGRK